MSKQNHSRALAARLFAAGTLLASAGNALADVRYVDLNSTSPTPPYTSWVTAATNIQDAVDAAVAGDEIVVTNGLYATGGRPVGTDLLSNRVAVDKPLTLRSVNGPQFTVIQGAQVVLPATNFDAAVRCMYLGDGASLSGFTLTNGGTRDIYDFPTNRESSGGGLWCESTNTVAVSNCVIVGNSARSLGGGAYGGTLADCLLSGNFVDGFGGGTAYSKLNRCTLSHNRASLYGGGSSGSTLNRSTLTENSADWGGGGSYNGVLINCALSGNSASGIGYVDSGLGGGAGYCTLNNCTLTGNFANDGGGAFGSTLRNCIVWFNAGTQEANYDSSSTLDYCCTSPEPTNGRGNISLNPQLANFSRLSAGSPCRGGGNAAYATDVDIDGEAWASPPSIGCDEYRAGAIIGPLSVTASSSFTNVLPGFAVQLTAGIDGKATGNVWDFGDGTCVTNEPYTVHTWNAVGNYTVVCRAYNEAQPGGVAVALTIHVIVQPVHYVSANSAGPLAPYSSWTTAATSIQDAVDAATIPGALVLVANGIYPSGGRAGNRVAVDKPVSLQSVQGPASTIIDGGGSVRCVYLTNGASLSGFTLTNGVGQYGHGSGWGPGPVIGGGLWCESPSAVASNCVVSGNSAVALSRFGSLSSASGGGVYGGTLNNCIVSGNQAVGLRFNGEVGGYGGGAADATLNNCTITGNAAASGSILDAGGGASGCTLNNCIVYYNESWAGDDSDGGTLNYCCTSEPGGFGNITNAPLFVDQASGNLRLQFYSPCINAGLNALAPVGPDLDGNPRIKGGMVDIGAYEYQSPTSMISYAWLQQFGLPTDGSADTADPDGDGLNNWQEWRCGTDPTNALSALRMVAPAPVGSDIVVRWDSVADRSYFLERSTTASTGFTPLATGIPGQPGRTIYTDTNAIGAGPWFYRVGVGAP